MKDANKNVYENVTELHQCMDQTFCEICEYLMNDNSSEYVSCKFCKSLLCLRAVLILEQSMLLENDANTVFKSRKSI